MIVKKNSNRVGELSKDRLNKNISFNRQQSGTLGREKILSGRKSLRRNR